MSLRRISIAIGAAALALALPAATTSFARDTASFTIRGTVPTICRVEFNSTVTPVAGQTTDLGDITELCNDWAGYQVTLITPPNLTGSSAIIDGTTVPLAANGETVIVDLDSDAYKQQDVKIQLAAGATSFAQVKFNTTPKGATFH